MRHTLRSLTAAATLLVAFAPAPHAGGMGATLSGPAKDGTYTLHAYACTGPASVRPSGWAEGVVNGARRTVPLDVEATSEAGVYRFARDWPRDGHWLLRFTFAPRNDIAMVAELDRKGRPRENRTVGNSDGRKECEERLAAAAR